MEKLSKIIKNQQLLRILAVVVAVMMVAAGAYYYLSTANRISIENSTVNTPIISLSATTGGTLKEVDVVEGETVKKGDQLAIVGTEVIRAATDGMIIETNQQVGGLMSPGVPVIKMVNPSLTRIDGVLDENRGLNKIRPGQVVAFTIDALPGQTFWGYVDEVGQTARQTQVAFSISSERPTQQFDVYAKFDAVNFPQIKNGMSAKMTVYLNNS